MPPDYVNGLKMKLADVGVHASALQHDTSHTHTQTSGTYRRAKRIVTVMNLCMACAEHED